MAWRRSLRLQPSGVISICGESPLRPDPVRDLPCDDSRARRPPTPEALRAVPDAVRSRLSDVPYAGRVACFLAATTSGGRASVAVPPSRSRAGSGSTNDELEVRPVLPLGGRRALPGSGTETHSPVVRLERAGDDENLSAAISTVAADGRRLRSTRGPDRQLQKLQVMWVRHDVLQRRRPAFTTGATPSDCKRKAMSDRAAATVPGA